ncbi:SusC/RagA family TonB-linked outer membrane protein [Arcticibacterium luteifluviistationis]|nr:TonB-dependent receptor [Arcticibacterium luteifluviistationis]
MKKKIPIPKHLWKFMKITGLQIILLLIGLSFASAKESSAQEVLDRTITLRTDNLELRDVLKQIEKQAEVKFVYSTKIEPGRLLSIDLKKAKLSHVLDNILKPVSVGYEVIENRILLKKLSEEQSILITLPKEKPSNQVTLLQVSGTIKDENNLTLPGVSVILKGSLTGTTSDADGKYQLAVPDEKATLIFSFVGYVSQEVVVGNKSTIDITLNTDVQTLEDVVVVGYGTVKKSDLTGSVSSVKAEQIAAYPAGGITQALQGRAAGVQISSNNGDPGASFKIRVRGSSSINASSDPIFVVDGFVGGQWPPPEDIESIEILKDASATAIYGSRGANGVVMITTKKGKAGKTQVNFNTSYSSQNEINRLDLLNAEQFTDYIQEINPDYVSPGGSTDWQDQMFRTGGIQNHQLSFSGGNQNLKYYLSGSIFDQKGIIIGSDFDRYSLTNNLSFKINEKIQLGMNMFAQRSTRNGITTQEGSAGAAGLGVVSSAFKFMPNQDIFNPDGTYTTALLGDPIDNPYALVREPQNETVADRLQVNFSADFDLLKNLKFRTTLGASTNNLRYATFTPTTLNAGRNVGGNATVNGNKSTNVINENYLTFNKTFAENHNVNILGGYSYQKTNGEAWGGRSQGFISDALSFWNLGAGSVYQAPNSGTSSTQLSSYFGRVNYGFADKYLFTFTGRYDGSSNFSKNNKWAFFPSGAFAWNIMNEEFMQNFNAFTSWKIRTSYGLTGNQAISPYQTLARFSPELSILNGSQVNAVRPTTVANDNLTWETTAQFDIGTDISFANNRFTVTADYYSKITRDLLFAVPLPEYSGFQTQLKNIGKVGNKGVELGLDSKVLTGEFKWDVNLNISANRNKVLELPEDTDIQYASGPGHMVGIGNTQILRVGAPVGSFFGWIYDGVYQAGDEFLPGGGFEQIAGGEKFRDINGIKDANGVLTGEPDGVLNSDDRDIIGDPNPDFIWGITSNFNWKNFDLSIFFQGSQGNDLLSFSLLEIESMGGSYNSTTRALERWTPTNTDTDIPIRSASRAQRVSTRWVYDGSYARLKNLAIGYNLPAGVANKLHLNKLRIYASAQNILTFTKYPGYDPEVNYNSGGSGSSSNRNLGLDYGSYPNAKSYTIGLNIGL